jgi:hypothetical protein
MEMQINFAADGGEEIKRGVYSDGVETWSNFRIPHKADSDPYFKDWLPRIPLDLHCSEIGFSGWDWEQKISRFVVADIDSVFGHKDCGLKPEQLQIITEKLITHPWVDLRRSTGGQGYHVYAFCPDVPSRNHTEHARLAKRIFYKIGQDLDIKLGDAIDVCGLIAWFWSRKMTLEKRSYERIS